MRKIFTLALLLAIGFYVAWPAWSGYQIYQALETSDATRLEGKIDFDSVRGSLRPVVAAEVDKQMDAQLKQLGQNVPAGDLKKQLAPKLVDATLATVVTPANVVKLYRERGDIAAGARKIMGDEMGKSGGGLPGLGAAPAAGGALGNLGNLGNIGNVMGKLGLPGSGSGTQQPAPAPAQQPAEQKASSPGTPPAFGVGNIKSFSFEGPLSMVVGVARDASAPAPDVTAVMTFTGTDWKVTKIIPRL